MKYNLIDDYSVREYEYKDGDYIIPQPLSYPGTYKRPCSSCYSFSNIDISINNGTNETIHDI